jgi:hypothetical protein
MGHISCWSVLMILRDTIKKGTETFTDSRMEVALEVYAQKSKHVLLLLARIQDKFMTQRQLTLPLKTCHRSDAWVRQ